MTTLRFEDVKADSTGLRALGPDPIPDGLFGIFGHERF